MRARELRGLLVAPLMAACVDREPMEVQARDMAYGVDPDFADERAMRPAVPGALSQEWHRRRASLIPSRFPDGGLSAPEHFPLRMSRGLVDQGRGHFETWCSPCHGLLGDGQSRVARNMRLRPPPALYGPLHAHTPPRNALEVDGGMGGRPGSTGWEVLPHPPGFYFDVITHGYGLMPSYADALPPEDAWAVVAWLRVLAYSQQAPLSAAPDEVQAALRQATGQGGAP
ncbi:cytochrome c [Myxococcus stipitatus]|uniref:c-type cytochrome n=1 Tax=Myxococcus stipitatus TaxID=83455 RepID=UPI0030D3982E